MNICGVSLLVGFSLLSGIAHAGSSSEEATSVMTFDGQKLSAKWSLPKEPPRGVLVIVQGSGSVDFDGDVSNEYVGAGYKGAPTRLSAQLADALGAADIATLRYSKRGFDDKMQLENQTLPFLVKDAEAALAMVRDRFPTLKAGFLGFSEGSLVSVIASSEQKVDVLFVMGLVSRPINEIFAYQYLQWPVDLLRRKIDLNHDGVLSADELARAGTWTLPISHSDWKLLDADKSGDLSIESEVVPAYEGILESVTGLMQGKDFGPWYRSLVNAAPFKEYASKISAPVFVYHALDDAQVNWSWPEADRSYFAGKTMFRLFAGLGHCFAPMDGAIGEVKTSGPFSSELLQTLTVDAQRAF